MSALTYSNATTIESEYDATKSTTINAMAQILDNAINGQLDIVTTGGTTTLVGTAANPQAQNMFLNISGTLASNAIIQIPVAVGTGRNRIYFVKNGTTGAFSVTVRVVGGTGVTITQSKVCFMYYTGTDIAKATAEL